MVVADGVRTITKCCRLALNPSESSPNPPIRPNPSQLVSPNTKSLPTHPNIKPKDASPLYCDYKEEEKTHGPENKYNSFSFCVVDSSNYKVRHNAPCVTKAIKV